MDDLVLDAESLFNIADVIDGYCAKQREVVNVYYAQIMALESEWRDDETFGSMVEELTSLRNKAIAAIEEVYEVYPKYFRNRAQQILDRPVYHPESTTVIGGGIPNLSYRGTSSSHRGYGTTYTGNTNNGVKGRVNSSSFDGTIGKSASSQSLFKSTSGLEKSAGNNSGGVGSTPTTTSSNISSSSQSIARCLSKTEQVWDKTSYPGGEVFDTPIETGRNLDYEQGKVEGYCNTCGVVSCENIARLAGLSVEEFEALDIAIKNDLCNKYRKGLLGRVRQGGGTSPESRKEILKHLGIDSYLEEATVDNIAKRVIEGRGVIISVRAGKLWNNGIKGLHAITVTSVMRGYDGSIQGFFICDSGRHSVSDSSAFYRVDEIQAALTPNRSMNVTTNIIR